MQRKVEQECEDSVDELWGERAEQVGFENLDFADGIVLSLFQSVTFYNQTGEPIIEKKYSRHKVDDVWHIHNTQTGEVWKFKVPGGKWQKASLAEVATLKLRGELV